MFLNSESQALDPTNAVQSLYCAKRFKTEVITHHQQGITIGKLTHYTLFLVNQTI